MTETTISATASETGIDRRRVERAARGLRPLRTATVAGRVVRYFDREALRKRLDGASSLENRVAELRAQHLELVTAKRAGRLITDDDALDEIQGRIGVYMRGMRAIERRHADELAAIRARGLPQPAEVEEIRALLAPEIAYAVGILRGEIAWR